MCISGFSQIDAAKNKTSTTCFIADFESRDCISNFSQRITLGSRIGLCFISCCVVLCCAVLCLMKFQIQKI
jgi:hypothetical protein